MKKSIIALVAFLAPVAAFAQQADAFSILGVITRIINILIPLAIAAGVLYFIWGVIKYVTAKDEEAQTQARSTMISGIIGLFVIVSIWGLVRVIQRTFNLTENNSINSNDIPCVPLIDTNYNQNGPWQPGTGPGAGQPCSN